MRNIEWHAVIAGILLLGLILFFSVLVFAIIEEGRVQQACLAAGYEGFASFLRTDRQDFCLKRANGASITVPLSDVERGQ